MIDAGNADAALNRLEKIINGGYWTRSQWQSNLLMDACEVMKRQKDRLNIPESHIKIIAYLGLHDAATIFRDANTLNAFASAREAIRKEYME